MTEHEGLFSIPTRLLLAPGYREKLAAIVRARDLDLADLVSELVVAYLDAQPDQAPEPAASPGAPARSHHAELARLRARSEALGGAAPAWLQAYIAGLEAEES